MLDQESIFPVATANSVTWGPNTWSVELPLYKTPRTALQAGRAQELFRLQLRVIRLIYAKDSDAVYS
jgi:hypothetical protein